MAAATGVGSVLQHRNKLGSGQNPVIHRPEKPGVGVVPLYRFGKRSYRSYALRRLSDPNATSDNKSLFGSRVRRSGPGSEQRLHLWQSPGPGRDPKLKVVVRSAFSQVPEKPLGLYDPAYDKDSCGVGFVAELSGESSRKTVRIWFDLSNLICF